MGDDKALWAKCPCCGKEVRLSKQKAMGGEGSYRLAFEGGEENPQAVGHIALPGFCERVRPKRLRIYWACNGCIMSGRALQGNPKHQRYGCGLPYFAYFDDTRTCEECGSLFVFTKEEQKHWYEELKFWVLSRPKRCRECTSKRKGRNQRSANS